MAISAGVTIIAGCQRGMCLPRARAGGQDHPGPAIPPVKESLPNLSASDRARPIVCLGPRRPPVSGRRSLALAADRSAAPSQGDGQAARVAPGPEGPDFAPDSTLPPLARWGWAMSFDVAKELADRWGYAVEFSGYVSEKVADEARGNARRQRAARLAAVAADPRKYKLGVLLDRQFPEDMPPEAYLRDSQGEFLADKWNKKASSRRCRTTVEQAGQLAPPGWTDSAPCPIAVIQNGGEYRAERLGLGPEVLAAGSAGRRGQGDMDWYRYISRQSPRAEGRRGRRPVATPDRLLYVFYTCGGGTLSAHGRETYHDDWSWDYSGCASARILLRTSTIITTTIPVGSARTTCSPEALGRG